MGYRGKLAERNQARDLRAQGYKLFEIAEQLGVSKSSVSLWVRDVDFVPRDPRYGRWRPDRKPSSLSVRKQEEIERLCAEGKARIGRLSDREFLVAGVALYAGEGAKTEGAVKFANTNPQMVLLFCAWLRRFFAVDEKRLRLRLYLHEGLDLAAAERFWSELTGIPTAQFGKPYRAVPDASIRQSKHPMGCPSVIYSCTSTHRALMGMVAALLSCETLPG